MDLPVQGIGVVRAFDHAGAGVGEPVAALDGQPARHHRPRT
ncbi:hypothetical protein ACU61A_25045 [Pseudonocardia sichuanensis]|nr:hypothetical protein [Pseudonocardia kunmingensis]